MLSLRRCRDILGPNCRLTDSQLELLRDQLMMLADISLDEARQHCQGWKNAFKEPLSLVPANRREEIIERAAIMEIDGGVQRTDAEKAALKEWARAQRGEKNEYVN